MILFIIQNNFSGTQNGQCFIQCFSDLFFSEGGIEIQGLFQVKVIILVLAWSSKSWIRLNIINITFFLRARAWYVWCFSGIISFLFYLLKNVMTSSMVLSVRKRVGTVTKENSATTWRGCVWLDVTQECMEISVWWVRSDCINDQ